MTGSRTSPLETTWRGAAKRRRGQFGMAVPACFDERDAELTRLTRLGIADVSGLPRVTVKGPDAADHVAAAGLPVPDAWFEPVATGPWSFVARTGRAEFWIEGAFEAPVGALVFPREDASLLLVGGELPALLAETLSGPVELHAPARARLHFVQIARVGCAVMPRWGRVPAAQIWVDPTYATYVGEVVHAIARELGGGWVGIEVCEIAGLLPPCTSSANVERA